MYGRPRPCLRKLLTIIFPCEPAHDLCSKSMARNCSAEAELRNMRAGFVDLGVSARDAHTSFSTNPNKTAHDAFVDFFMLLDAAVVIRTGSSFSGMAVDLNGFVCSTAGVSAELPVSGMLICGPPHEPC